MFARWKLQICLAAIVVVGVALSSAFPEEPVAYAQGAEDGYVDVGLILDVPVTTNVQRFVNITVANHGVRTAYDVVVVVNIVYPENSSYFPAVPNVPVGSAFLENDDYSLRWTIPALGSLEYKSVSVTVDAQSRGDKTLDPHEFFGEVSTSSFESDLHKGNNTDRAWVRVVSTSTKASQSAGGILNTYSIDSVSVDQQNPSPGDIVNFTVIASPRTNIDKKVTIALTEGLAVDEDASATPAREINITTLIGPQTPDPPVSHSNGVFTIGTRKFGEQINQLSITLPVRVASDMVVNEQCLTATITGNPPPGPLGDDISDNEVKVCLGDQPVEPFMSGQVDAFTVYPCVGITDAPCDSTNDVRVRAVDSNGWFLAPGTAVFHIDSLKARIYDAKTGHSVNDGNTVSWQTAVTAGRPYADGLSSGVELYYSRTPFVNKTTGWGGLSFGIAARDVEGNTPPPGKVFLRSTSSGNEIRKAESPNYEELRTTATSISTTKINFFLEFEKLGTYEFTWHAVAKRSSLHGSENCNPNTDDPPVYQIFCASETYTFHVGPMADLAVEDGGASSRVAGDRSGLTIVAVNNGPDEPSGARVTGLPKDTEVIHISQGSYDEDAGEWEVGELKVRGYYGSRGESEPTLVLSAIAGDDSAEVTIASTKNHEVCIGPKSNPVNLAHTTQAACEAVANASWNSTPVYDYNSGNNTAKITAVKGTGGGGPSEARFAATPVLTWGAVPHVNDWPVHRYQVQYLNGDNWLDLAEVPGDQTYFADSDARSKPSYRVRALNEAGVPGFWSRSASQVTYRQALPPSPPLNVTAVAGHAGEVVVSWDLPVDDGGSPITYYQVQWSRSGTGGWSNACRSDGPSDLSCTQTGIPAGETRYYRVAAYAGGLGDWSDLAVATTIAGVPSAPRSLSASRAPYSSGDIVFPAIRLTWSAPATDNGSPISAYAIEYVNYDQSAGRCGTDWKFLAGTGYPYTDPPAGAGVP